MSARFKQVEGLVSFSGTVKPDPCREVKLKNYPQHKQGIQTGDFVSLKKQPKHFDDGPLLPLSPSQEQNDLQDGFKTPDLDFAKKPSFQPQVDYYIPGLVQRTSKVVVVDLAENIQRLTSGTTGAIEEEGFEPTRGLYSEGSQFSLEKKLSKGSFGSGALCFDLKSNKKFFQKTIVLENFRSSEVTVPISLNHENVTKLYGVIRRNEKNVELLIEPAGMALNTYVQNNTIETQRMWDILRQIMAGLNHMHLYGMIHFDIKPENICIKEKEGKCCIVKITDFGSAKLPQEEIPFIGWTPEYMCPETSQLYLQKRGSMKGVIKESDITGKVDVFAAALVIMYLYVKEHLLLRLITHGKTSYKDYDDKSRTSLQLDILRMLAEDSRFIKCVVPDACDIDMRELLEGMTQHDQQDRYTAQDIINFIDSRYLRKKQSQQNEKALNGTIKKSKVAALRGKLKPNTRRGQGKMMKVETPVKVLKRKQMEDISLPLTPISEVAMLKMRKTVNHSERNAVVTQPMAEHANQIDQLNDSRCSVQSQPKQVMVPDTISPMKNKVIQPRPYQPASTSLFRVQDSTQNTFPNVNYLMVFELNKGQVKIHMKENGPELVQVQKTQATVTQNRSGVRPFIPASSPNMTHGELEFPDVSSSVEMVGNLPCFLKRA